MRHTRFFIYLHFTKKTEMRNILLATLLAISSTTAFAQDYAGYNTSNYNGVNGVFFNPSNVVDSRYKWSVNLFSINTTFTNNYGTFNTKNLFKSSVPDSDKIVRNSSTTPSSALLNFDVFGPSVMFNLNSKSSFAITTRGRMMLNVERVPGDLLNSLINNGNNATYPSAINANNAAITAHAWSELGLTYGRVLTDDKTHFLKGGITLKYLGGLGAGYFGVNVNTQLNKDPNTGDTYLQGGGGQLNYGAGGIDFNDFKFKINGSGIGGDIGFTYEYRPTEINGREKNKYKYKIDIALHDVGGISYNHGTNDAAYTLNLNPSVPTPGSDTLLLKRFNNVSSFDDIDTILHNASPKIGSPSNATGKFTESLPTSLTAAIDYNVVSHFYVNLGGMLSLNKGSISMFQTHTINYIMLTPRLEGKHFGISLPLSDNSIAGFNAGVSLRAGPFFIGSGSVLSTLIKGKTEQADFHLGFVVNGLQKKKKEKKVKESKEVVAAPVAKAIDTDGDGIVDSLDKCPTVPGLAKYNGCPIPDTDGDGINDEDDKCPTIPGLAKYHGCPIPDTDGDGINDEEDKCPTVPGVLKYHGCPIPDSDSDGVNDEDDRCPTVVGLARYHGCPIPDSDSDGVNDEIDKCPTLKGPASNYGCPLVKKSLIQKVNFAAKGLLFQTGKAVILKQSYPKLNSVVLILKADPTLNIDLAGYTDNVGDSIKNKKLSEDRANAAKAYFVKKGIKESRITAEGYGDEKPIATNKTPVGRAKNRRVEFTLKNY